MVIVWGFRVDCCVRIQNVSVLQCIYNGLNTRAGWKLVLSVIAGSLGCCRSSKLFSVGFLFGDCSGLFCLFLFWKDVGYWDWFGFYVCVYCFCLFFTLFFFWFCCVCFSLLGV